MTVFWAGVKGMGLVGFVIGFRGGGSQEDGVTAFKENPNWEILYPT